MSGIKTWRDLKLDFYYEESCWELSVDVKLCRAAKIKLLSISWSGEGSFCSVFSKIIILKAFLSRLRRYQHFFSQIHNKNKEKCFLFPMSASCGINISNDGLFVNIREMFLIAFLFCFTFQCLTKLVFLSLFLFPETIPSGVHYKLMRLKDERLIPGWKPLRGRADVEISNTIFFFFLLHTNKTATEVIFFLFLFDLM